MWRQVSDDVGRERASRRDEDVEEVGESQPADDGRGPPVRRRPAPHQVALAARAHHCPRHPGISLFMLVVDLLLCTLSLMLVLDVRICFADGVAV